MHLKLNNLAYYFVSAIKTRSFSCTTFCLNTRKQANKHIFFIIALINFVQLFSVEKLITFLPLFRHRQKLIFFFRFFFVCLRLKHKREEEANEEKKANFPNWINFIPIYQRCILAAV
jgi:hypothetical protein